MNHIISFFALFTVIAQCHAFSETDPTWNYNYTEVIEKAKDTNRLVLADFTGSDWCKWCIKLDEEILSKKEFRDFAKSKVILFKADFPMYKTVSPEIKKQNYMLKDKFDVEGFPTLLFINPYDESVKAEVGYEQKTPAEYVKELNEIVKKNQPSAKK